MKKCIFPLTVLCFVFIGNIAVHAQYLGVKLGLTSSTLAGDDVDNVDAKRGITGGLFAIVPLTPVISLQPQALVTAKGSQENVPDNGQSYTSKVKLTYFELPVLVVLHAPDSEAALRPMIFTGPSMAFNISSKADELIPGEGLTEIDLKEATRETDLSWIFGGGLAVPLGRNLLMFSVQYAVGMSTIDDSVEDAFDVKNRVLSFELGFGFGIGEE